MAKRTYTPQQRTDALEQYRTDGPTAASATTGIPKQTIASWAAADGVRTVRSERMGAAIEARRLEWAERQVELVHEMGEIAAVAAARARRELSKGSARDGKDAAVAMAVFVDKAQLLSGAATGRHDVHAVRAEVMGAAGNHALRLVG